jgi:adhesin transport system outer membrane protein
MRALFTGTVLLWSAAVCAQSAPWSYTELLKQSLQSHPSIQARRSTATAAQFDIDSAEWQRFPTPTLEALSRSSSTPNVPNGRLRVQQPIWTGGRITAGIDGANARKDAADSGITETQQDIALRVATGYVEAARFQAREEYARRSVGEHERLLGLIGRRVQQEVSPPVDRELAQSRLYQAQNEVSSSSQFRRSALAQLTQLVDRPVTQVAALDSRVEGVPPSQDEALQRAIAYSPTLLRIAAEERAAAADVDTRRSAFWPQLGVRYERDYGGPFAQDNRLLVVVEATPGAGLSAGSNVDAARSRQTALQLDRAAALRDLQERIAIDWTEYTAARERLTNAELARKTATEVYESFSRQYTAGRKTWVDVMNSVREQIQAEFTAVDVLAQVVAAGLRLNILTGQFNPAPAKQ